MGFACNFRILKYLRNENNKIMGLEVGVGTWRAVDASVGVVLVKASYISRRWN